MSLYKSFFRILSYFHVEKTYFDFACCWTITQNTMISKNWCVWSRYSYWRFDIPKSFTTTKKLISNKWHSGILLTLRNVDGNRLWRLPDVDPVASIQTRWLSQQILGLWVMTSATCQRLLFTIDTNWIITWLQTKYQGSCNRWRQRHALQGKK